MSKVLVIGGAGWIAGSILGRVRDSGLELEVFDLKNGQDLFDTDQLDQAVAGVDVVLHMAAIPHFDETRPWEDFRKMNVEGTAVVAKAAAKFHKRLVSFSSGSVYGFDGGFRPTEVRPLPIDWTGDFEKLNFYAQSKLLANAEIRAAMEDGGCAVILRVNWPGGCPHEGLLAIHMGAEVTWELLADIVSKALTVELPDGVHIFNAINLTQRDGSPAQLEVQNRVEALGV